MEMEASDMSISSEDEQSGCFYGNSVEVDSFASCGKKDVLNGSTEIKRFWNASVDYSAMDSQRLRKKQKSGKTSMEEPDFGSGSSINGCVTGNSGVSCVSGESGADRKRRQSRWDSNEGKGTNEQDDGDATRRKRRKSRWDSLDRQVKLLGPLTLANFMKEYVLSCETDPEMVNLNAEFADINYKLRKPVLNDLRPVEERSPSPEPVYNNLGIRVNTREIRIREKMNQARLQIISKLIQKQPTFKPQAGVKVDKLFKKVYIPVKQYPDYNFAGIILGPWGNTQKRMEKETGAKISLRGVGSSLRHNSASDRDDLHVYIEAVKMVEKLLVPMEDGMNAHKRAQLQELAALKQASLAESKSFISSVRGPLTTAPVLSNHVVKNFSLQGISNNLRVGHLPSSVDDRLKELFCPIGKLVEAKVIKAGNSKRYGFVKFENIMDASLAVSHLNGFKMENKTLAVIFAGQAKAGGAITAIIDIGRARGPAAWPGPPGSQLLEPRDSSSPSYGAQTDWPAPPVSQLCETQDRWSGPPGLQLFYSEPIFSNPFASRGS